MVVKHLRFTALPVDAVVDGREVGHNILRLSADIGGRVEGGLYLRARHLFQNLQRDALGPVTGHDEVDGAVADTVPAAAIVVRDTPQAHLDDAKNGRVFCIENDTPFSQQRLLERLYHT